jgi:protein-S-isoprenylcysteine O-methyltransferase Ste14
MRWKLQPPLLAGVVLGLAVAFHLRGPAMPLLRLPLVGWLLLIGGTFIIGWARLTFTKINTSLFVGDAAAHLVLQGPFRYSRNPMYVGITLCSVALGLITGSAYYVAAAAIFFVVIALAYVPFEEDALQRVFGRDYEDYRKRVRRWI